MTTDNGTYLSITVVTDVTNFTGKTESFYLIKSLIKNKVIIQFMEGSREREALFQKSEKTKLSFAFCCHKLNHLLAEKDLNKNENSYQAL